MSKLLLINDVSSSPFNKFCDNLARSSDCFINLSLFAFDFELKICCILVENFTYDDLGTLYGAAELIFRGWPNEALPFSTKKKSIISAFFERFFS